MDVIKENKMGTMPVGKLLLNMSAPMIASMLFQALYNIVDSVFVARLGQDAMNAVSLSFPFQTLIIAFSVGTGVGMNSVISKSLGEKNSEKADTAANNGIVLFLITSIVFSIIGLSCSKAFFSMQTDNENIIRYGTAYISVCIGLCPAVFAQMCSERLLQSTGRTDLSMIPQITGAAINMILDPIMIFGLLGFPRLEVMGAAVATVIGQTIASVIGFTLNIYKNPEIKLSFAKMKLKKDAVLEIYKIGIPSIVMQAIGSFMNLGLNKILIGFTEAATAVFGAYYKVQSFIFMPVFGLNSALIPIVSFNYGAKKVDRLKKIIKLGIFAAVGIMTIGMIAFETIPDVLLGLFTPTEEMLEVGKTAFRVIGITFPFAGFAIVAGAVCQATGKPIYMLITSISRQIGVLMPAAYLLSLTGNLKAVWFAFPIAEVVSFSLAAIFLKMTLKRIEQLA